MVGQLVGKMSMQPLVELYKVRKKPTSNLWETDMIRDAQESNLTTVSEVQTHYKCTCSRALSIVNCSNVPSLSSLPGLDWMWWRNAFSLGNCGKQDSSILYESESTRRVIKGLTDSDNHTWCSQTLYSARAQNTVNTVNRKRELKFYPWILMDSPWSLVHSMLVDISCYAMHSHTDQALPLCAAYLPTHFQLPCWFRKNSWDSAWSEMISLPQRCRDCFVCASTQFVAVRSSNGE